MAPESKICFQISSVFTLNRAVTVSVASQLLAHRLFQLHPKSVLKSASGFPRSGAVAVVCGGSDLSYRKDEINSRVCFLKFYHILGACRGCC